MGQEGLQIGAALGILNRSKKITNQGRDFKPDKEISNLGINYKSGRKRLQTGVGISSRDRDYKSVQSNNSPSVMRFQASNDILFHWLKNWRSVWGQKNKLNICQVENRRMCCTAVKDKSNFSFIHAEFPIKFADTVYEDLSIPATLLSRDILARQIFNIFKTVRVFLVCH